MTAKANVQIGEVYEIPLVDGRHAYCQYVLYNRELGYMVRVFSLLAAQPIGTLETLRGSPLMFPPVFVALKAIVRADRWKRVGTLPVEDFSFPKFRFTMGTKPGVYHDWSIWDGANTRKIGDLPESQRTLQLKCISGCETIEERIATGSYRGDKMF